MEEAPPGAAIRQPIKVDTYHLSLLAERKGRRGKELRLDMGGWEEERGAEVSGGRDNLGIFLSHLVGEVTCIG